MKILLDGDGSLDLDDPYEFGVVTLSINYEDSVALIDRPLFFLFPQKALPLTQARLFV